MQGRKTDFSSVAGVGRYSRRTAGMITDLPFATRSFWLNLSALGLACLCCSSALAQKNAASLVANNFSGTDIFAQANAAAASLAGTPGVVTIAPGNYSGVVTTLGVAISCQAVSRAKITGPLHLLGASQPGTVGLYVGSPNPDLGLTTENRFSDITIGDTPGLGASNGFDVGIRVDGNVNAGTYYNKFDRVSSNGNLNQGWLILPSLALRANSNRCIACTAVGNGGDGFQIDGVTTWTFLGTDAENNGAYNFNFPGTMQTSEISVFGGDFEGAALADFNFGGGINVSKNCFLGMNVGSNSPFAGSPHQGLANLWWPGNSPAQLTLANGALIDLPVGEGSGTTIPSLWVRDTENGWAASDIFRISRTAPGQGSIALATDNYPLTIGGTLTVSENEIVSGNLTVKGVINKGADNFRIDHPLDPAHKFLSHSVIESPEMKNLYDGIAVLDRNGEAWVQLPSWFQALNRGFRYQLTCIGGSAPVYIADEIRDNRFRIAGRPPRP